MSHEIVIGKSSEASGPNNEVGDGGVEQRDVPALRGVFRLGPFPTEITQIAAVDFKSSDGG